MKQIRFGTGLDNQHDPQQVGANGLVVSVNFDARDDKTAVTRKGYIATTLTGADCHSLWGSKDQTFGYLMDGATLYHLGQDLTKTQVGTMPTSDSVEFVEMLGMVAAISVSAIRFVKGTAFFTPDPFPTFDGETQFLSPMTDFSGTGGTFFNGQLFVVAGDSLLCSVAGYPTHYDTRDYIVALGGLYDRAFPVDDGMWIAGPSSATFLTGQSKRNFTFRDVLPFGIHSGVPVLFSDLGMDAVGSAHIVSTEHGTHILTNSGQAIDLSKGKYHPQLGSGHVSVLRQCNGYKQFLTCFTYGADGSQYVAQPITIDHADL